MTEATTNELTRQDGKQRKSCGCTKALPAFRYQPQHPPARGTHPLLREALYRMKVQQIPLDWTSRQSGIASCNVRRWKAGTRSPRLADFDAFVQALGGRLHIDWSEQEP